MNSCFKVGANIIKAVSNVEGENSDNDEQEDNLPELYTYTGLQSQYNQADFNEKDWQEMINRARLRGLRQVQQEGALRPEDKLWEIGCHVKCFLQPFWSM